MLKGSDIILASTHRLFSEKLYDEIKTNYNIELNREKLIWGSVSPDIYPKYKLYRHYYEESINFIALRVMKLIHTYRNLDFRNISYKRLKSFSRELGIITHYLADYTCLAHDRKWKFPIDMKIHIDYESRLDEYSKNHEFKRIRFDRSYLQVDALGVFDEFENIKKFIESVVLEYREEVGLSRDLNYALSLNICMTNYIMESILEYSNKKVPAYSY